MNRIFSTIIVFLTVNFTYAQHLYQEKYDGCKTSSFCLDCGDSKATPPFTFDNELTAKLDPKSLRNISGLIQIQVLVDTLGNPCLLSAYNGTNLKSKDLNLQNAINSTTRWTPAKKSGKPIQSSVSFFITFQKGKSFSHRIDLNVKNRPNIKSIGKPDVQGSDKEDLTETWTVYDQNNSDLPWDMSRAIIATKDAVWLGTDNGLAKIADSIMTVFNLKNTPIKPLKYDKNAMSFIHHAGVDKKDNLWVLAGSDAYKYDGKNWTVFDSLNSTVNAVRSVFVDDSNNLWFTGYNGISKYDGKKWTAINTSNSKLPSNRTTGVFVDSKNRLWIGTHGGNIRIDNKDTIYFNMSNTPLKDSYIVQVQEDSKGNIWFNLHNYSDNTKAGMFVLKTNGEWMSVKSKEADTYKRININYFLLDDEKNILWIAYDCVGLCRYDITNDKWETYTNYNSNIPSIHIMQITKDKDGMIWAATFAGIVRMNKKKSH